VLCLIVVPLPPGENPFAVKINNNNNNMGHIRKVGHKFYMQTGVRTFPKE
jgi:hypothetical protein